MNSKEPSLDVMHACMHVQRMWMFVQQSGTIILVSNDCSSCSYPFGNNIDKVLLVLYSVNLSGAVT